MKRPVRRTERGAAIFIVVMVITLLTAIGVFSARAASLVDVAAGHDRQAVQTFYVTEYGARTLASELGAPGIGESYRKTAKAKAEPCSATANVVPEPPATTVPCYPVSIADLAPRIDANFAGRTLFDVPTTAAPGSLGPKLQSVGQQYVAASFRVEMSDFGPPLEPLPGTDLSGGPACRPGVFTLTAIGKTHPSFTTPGTCDQASSAAAGVQTMRAHVLVPGICP